MTLLDEFLGREDYVVRVRKAEKAHRLSKDITTRRFSSSLYGLFAILLRIWARMAEQRKVFGPSVFSWESAARCS